MSNPTTTVPPLPDKLHILVATPHREFGSALGAMLKSLGIKEIAKAHESDVVARLLRANAYDAIILDRAMGPEDGVALTRKLRTSADSPNATAPIIMISGISDRKFIEMARDAGVNEFIRMPVSGDILHARLHAALSHPREFVASQAYSGPDRRRHKFEYRGPERRQSRQRGS
ncbi:response regulator transcription factor [Pelagibacterium limicola]|uniref:response regulator transcription factor n=1 Tax=Pelagibacterium limicola TaxID=2791022 RepID=UPI0018AF605B|nr:response regulator [Pelagibacterium limicola]